MRTPVRIAAFAAALGVVFGAAALAGGALDPLRDPADDGHGHAEVAAVHDGGRDRRVLDALAPHRQPAGGEVDLDPGDAGHGGNLPRNRRAAMAAGHPLHGVHPLRLLAHLHSLY